MDITDRALRTRMAGLDDERLRAILDASPEEYTPQAKNAAEAELRKRRSTPAERTEVSSRVVSHEPTEVWQVEPLPAKPVTESERATLQSRSREGLAGPVTINAIVAAVLVALVTHEPTVSIGAGLIVAAGLYHMVRSKRFQSGLRDLEESQIEAARKEASGLTFRLLKVLKDAEVVCADVEDKERAATRYLLHARREFSETAYAPFWDAVEGCASELGSVRANLQTIAAHATNYAGALKGRRHTFPPLRRTVPVGRELDAIQVEFKDVVRQGQRDFQFAVIWEHRKTRAAIVEGFRTLGDAVDGISAAIHTTSSMLETTLANGFADVVSGYERTGERLESSLNRIENHAAESAEAGREVREVISRYRLLG